MRACSVAGGFLLCLFLGMSADALTREEVVELSRAGITDRVILETMRVDGSRFALSAADVEQLRSAGVSEAVIAGMQATAASPASGGPVRTPAPEPDFSPLDRDSRRGARRAAPVPSPTAVPPLPSADATATLRLANDDDRVKGYSWDPSRRLLQFFPSVPAGAKALDRGASATLEIPHGVISVNWNGEWGHYRITLLPGARMEARSWPGTANGSPAVRLTVLRDGGLYGATNLKVFYGRALTPVRAVRVCPPCAQCP